MRDFRDRLQDILDAIGQIEVEQVKGRAAFDGSSLIQVWMVHHLADFERLGMKRMSNANQSARRTQSLGLGALLGVLGVSSSNSHYGTNRDAG